MLGSPVEQGWRVAHWLTAGVAAAGTAQGAVAAHCPDRSRAGAEGHCPCPVGPAQHSWCGLGLRGRGGRGRWGAEGRDCADTQCGVTPGRCVGRRWGVAQLRAYQPHVTVLARSPTCGDDQALCTLWHCLILWVRTHSAAQYHVPKCC